MMKLTLERAAFLNALGKVRPGLATKEVAQQSTYYVFSGGRVMSFNDSICVSCPLPGGEEIEGAVRADELYQYLSAATTDTVDITIEETMTVQSGKSTAGLPWSPEILSPILQLDSLVQAWDGEFTEVSPDLVQAMEFALFSCARDLSHPALSCVHLSKDNGVESCDNYRATRWRIECIPADALVPATSVKELIGHPVTGVRVSEEWIHFSQPGGVVFSCRTYGDSYPDLSPLFVAEETTIQTIDLPKDELIDLLTRAKIFTRQDVFLREQVEIKATKGRLYVFAEGPYGWMKEWTSTSKEQEFSFMIHPKFLIDILMGEAYECAIAGNKILFEGGEWQHLVALQGK